MIGGSSISSAILGLLMEGADFVGGGRVGIEDESRKFSPLAVLGLHVAYKCETNEKKWEEGLTKAEREREATSTRCCPFAKHGAGSKWPPLTGTTDCPH